MPGLLVLICVCIYCRFMVCGYHKVYVYVDDDSTFVLSFHSNFI